MSLSFKFGKSREQVTGVTPSTTTIVLRGVAPPRRVLPKEVRVLDRTLITPVSGREYLRVSTAETPGRGIPDKEVGLTKVHVYLCVCTVLRDVRT